MRFALAIFDLDGTLIDSRGDIAEALNSALEACGHPTHSLAVVSDMIGDGVGTLIARALGEAGRGDAERVRAAFFRSYESNLVRHTVLYPGIESLLREADAAGLPMAIATNKPGPWAREIVQRLGISDCFRRVIGELDGLERKPSPAILQELARGCDVALARAVLIGDSLVDVATARAAGVPIAAVAWGYGKPDALAEAQPEHIFHRAADLAALLLG